jgi:N-acyl-D-aspartate/D-glutamate deacylase
VRACRELLCYIEDLPAEVLDVSIPRGWESYGEYLSAVEKLGGFAVNVTGMVGHNMLRTYVMGEAAWDRPASEEERARCARTCSGWPT